MMVAFPLLELRFVSDLVRLLCGWCSSLRYIFIFNHRFHLINLWYNLRPKKINVANIMFFLERWDTNVIAMRQRQHESSNKKVLEAISKAIIKNAKLYYLETMSWSKVVLLFVHTRCVSEPGLNHIDWLISHVSMVVSLAYSLIAKKKTCKMFLGKETYNLHSDVLKGVLVNRACRFDCIIIL